LLLLAPAVSVSCREIGFLSKLNCYWFFCRYFVFAIVTIVALLASPIILWLDPWVWGFPTIYFLVSANVAVVVYLYFTIFSYIFLLFSVVSLMQDGAPSLHASTALACQHSIPMRTHVLSTAQYTLQVLRLWFVGAVPCTSAYYVCQ
jgi:hypothetical protein